MLKNKIKMILSYKNIKQNDLLNVLDLSGKQALSRKMSDGAFSVSDLVKVCDFLDLSLTIKDNQTGKEIVSFDMSDIKKD